jgi:isopentenyl-diphosphate Delta-isomerase
MVCIILNIVRIVGIGRRRLLKMDEMIDILDEKGNETTVKKMKSEAHQNGLWHRSVHLWICNDKKEILLQKRSKTKEMFPEVWDVSAAGHVASGESVDDALLREAKEELGISVEISKVKKFGTMKKVTPVPGWKYPHNEYIDVFFLISNQEHFTVQKEELSEVKLFPLDQFEQEIQDPKLKNKYIPDVEYQLHVIKLIKTL